jgi:hypothetical protein
VLCVSSQLDRKVKGADLLVGVDIDDEDIDDAYYCGDLAWQQNNSVIYLDSVCRP